VLNRTYQSKLLEAPKQGHNLGFIAEQYETQIGMPYTGDICTLQHHIRRLITAHRVKGKYDLLAHDSDAPAMFGWLRDIRRFGHFMVAIVAAGGTHMVG
jgi:hypothetical protein